jgi:tRNA A37 threonylcarbamoyladenosine synthetase subunit TsaC/SUA5/YrdC
VEIFDDNIDFYVDNGRLVSDPSTLITFQGDRVRILRQGKIKYDNL